MNFQQLEGLWVKNGGNPRWAPLMAAVALAESGGNAQAAWDTTTNTGGKTIATAGAKGATGLWQIEWPLHQAMQRASGGRLTRSALGNPTLKAKIAVQLFDNGRGWRNWQGDPIMAQWIAAGRPTYPTDKLVRGYMKAGGVGSGRDTTTTVTPGVRKGGRGPATATTTGLGSTPGTTKPPCAWHVGIGPFSGCVLSESQARSLKGGLLLVGGGLIMLVGVGMLAAFGFGSSAAQRQLRRAGIGGSSSISGSPPSRPAPNTTSSPAPETQAERNRRQAEALPPGVRDEARRRREAYGLQASSTPRPAPAPAAPARPAPAEQRPRAQATSSRSTRTGQPSRRAKRPHGRTTGLGPRARARRR